MLRGIAGVVLGAVALVAALAGPASAGGPDDFNGIIGDEGSSESADQNAQTSGDATSGTLVATVQVSGTTGEGTTYTAERRVGVAPMCWYSRGWTGQEYFQYRTSDSYQTALSQMPYQYRSIPYPKFEEYADVTDGYWFVPRCRDGVDYDYLREFLDTRPPRFWVPEDGPPPDVVDVDPRVLAEAAYDLVEIPTGQIDWNPKARGVGATLVNTDTWVWVTGAVQEVTATARVESGTWAQVQARVAGIEVDAEGADRVECAGLGTAWSAGADPGAACSVWFTRSSAGARVPPGGSLPAFEVTVTATWEASFTSSMHATAQALPSQQTTVTAYVPVAEVQALVTTGG